MESGKVKGKHLAEVREIDLDRETTDFELQFGTVHLLCFDIRICAFAALRKVLQDKCKIHIDHQPYFVNDVAGNPPKIFSEPDIYTAVMILRHEASENPGAGVFVRKSVRQVKGSGFVVVKIPMTELTRFVKHAGSARNEAGMLASCEELFQRMKEALKEEMVNHGLGIIRVTSFKVFPHGMSAILKNVEAGMKHVVNVFYRGEYLLTLEAGFFSHFEIK